MKRIPLPFYIFLAFFVTTLTFHAHGYNLFGRKWTSGAFNYSINPIGIDNSTDYSSKTQTIIDAASQWAFVATTNVQVNYSGTTTNVNYHVNDGQNIIVWKTDGWTGNVIGISASWISGGQIIDSDIKLNTAFADDYRLPILVTHEVGHSLGIDHTRENGEPYTTDEYNAVMYWLLHNQSQLNGQDKCAITGIYPASPACSPGSAAGYYEPQPCCSGSSLPISVQFGNKQHTYDGQNKSVTVTTNPSGVAYQVSYFKNGLPVSETKNAGTYQVLVTITDPGYSPTDHYETMTIAKAPLTLYTNNYTVTYGETEPIYTIYYDGFVNNENSSVLLSLPSASINKAWPALPGDHPIYIYGGQAENYSFFYSGSTLTVQKASITSVAFNDSLWIYNGLQRAISAVTTPPGIDFQITYKDSSNAVINPINAGRYEAVLQIIHSGYHADTFSYSFSIDKAPLVATGENKAVKFTEPEPPYTIQYTGFVNGETAGVIDILPVAQVSGNRPLLPGTYPIELNGGTDNNYEITRINGQLTVLTYDSITISLPQANATYTGLPHTPNIVVFPAGLTYTVEYRDSLSNPVAELQNTGKYQVSVTIDVPGYAKTEKQFQYEITKPLLTIKAQDINVVFKQNIADQISFSYSGFVNNESTGALDSLPLLYLQQTFPLMPGTYTIVPFGARAKNYQLVYQPGTLTVLPAQVQSIDIAYATAIFDGNPHPISVSTQPTGIAYTITYRNDLGQIVGQPVDAGKYSYQVDIQEPGYHSSTVQGELEIMKKELTIKVNNLQMVYGDSVPAWTYEYNGFIPGDSSNALDQHPEPISFEQWPLKTGTYPLGLTEGGDRNYALTVLPGTLTVSKALLTVTGQNLEQEYNQPEPEKPYMVTGYVFNENDSVLIEMPESQVIGVRPLEPGTYTILISGGEAENYRFEYTPGTLTVKPIGTSSIIIGENETVYDGTVKTAKVAVLPSGIAHEVTYFKDSIIVQPIAPGLYQGVVAISEPGYERIKFDFQFIIKKAKLKVTAHNQSVLTGDTIPSLTYEITGFVNGEGKGVIDTLPQAYLEHENQHLAGNITIIVAGGYDDNYEMEYQTGNLEIIQAYTIDIEALEHGWVRKGNDGEWLRRVREKIAINQNSSDFFAKAENGYKFKSWDNGDTLNPIRFTNLTSDKIVTAQFVPATSSRSIMQANSIDIRIYPNPVRSYESFRIEVIAEETIPGQTSIELFDLLGRSIATLHPEIEDYTHGGIAPGVYSIALRKSGRLWAQKKFVVK